MVVRTSAPAQDRLRWQSRRKDTLRDIKKKKGHLVKAWEFPPTGQRRGTKRGEGCPRDASIKNTRCASHPTLGAGDG